MTDAELVAGVLKEYSSRLNLDGSSIVLVPNESIALTVEEWSKKAYLSYIPAFTLDEDRTKLQTDWKHKEEAFTHVISILQDISKPSLQHLKWIQWSLRYKGLLVLVLAAGLEAEDSQIINFVERASFERGRIRCLRRKVSPDGQDVDRTVILAMKWDLLCA